MIRLQWTSVSPWYNPVVYCSWQWLIKLAWGPRRVSSRAPAGTKAYPQQIGATLGLWIKWIKLPKQKEPYIVIRSIGSGTESMLIKEYKEELRRVAEAKEKEEKKAKMLEQLETLQLEREEARAKGDYARADALRDQIEAAGIVVADSKIRK